MVLFKNRTFYQNVPHTCLPLFPGRPVGPLFPDIPGSPFGPISPYRGSHINVSLNGVKFTKGWIKKRLVWIVSHFLSKHSWEAHGTLWIKKRNLKAAYTVLYNSIMTCISYNTTPKLCPPCRLLLQSRHDPLENPAEKISECHEI